MCMFAAAHVERETVELAGELLDYETVVRYMDPRLYYLALEFAGVGAIGQAVLDEYMRMHEQHFKQPFAMQRR